MAEKLGCSLKEFPHIYLERYQEFFQHLKRELQDHGSELGEGKDGFKPAFLATLVSFTSRKREPLAAIPASGSL